MADAYNVFADLFDSKIKHDTTPKVPLDNMKFRLIEVAPHRKWIETGEFKPDGSPKYAPDPELELDETGERCNCDVSLTMVTPTGETSPAAPIKVTQFLDAETLKKLTAFTGEIVKLLSPRIEFYERAKTSPSGYAKIETKTAIQFDGFEV